MNFLPHLPFIRLCAFFACPVALLTGVTLRAEPLVLEVGAEGGPADLGAALAAVAAARSEMPGRPVTVLLPERVFRLAEPMVLGPEHGGSAGASVVFQPFEGARPVISGGRQLEGFQETAAGVWELRLEPGTRFDQLWVNGRRATRARYPDSGFFTPGQIVEEMLGENLARQTVSVPPEHLTLLAGLGGGELASVQLLAYHKWDNTRRFLETADPATGMLSVVGEPMKPWNVWDTHTGIVLENLRSALDAPGEWFLAPDGLLSYLPRPGEIASETSATAPLISQLLVVRGTEGNPVGHVQFRGITFQDTGWVAPAEGFSPEQAAASIQGTVQVDHANHLVFEDCTIRHTGGYGLWFRAGCTDNRVSRSHFHDLGAGAFRIGEMDDPAGLTARNSIEDSILRDGGHVFPCAVGLWIGASGDNRAFHNEISHFPYTGVSLGWRWGYEASPAKRNLVEFNHIHHIGDGLLSDMGGIYTLGPSEGTRLAHNHIHHILSYKYGGWGLYNDEGSTGIVAENNLVHHTTSGGYHQHYGRENIIRNNIFAYARDQQLQFTRPEGHRSFSFTGNIVLWESGPLFGSNGWRDANFEMDRNLYWSTATTDPDFLGKSIADWRAAGHDAESIIADPLFHDSAGGDWRLREDSPAHALGFQAFDPAAAGVRGTDAWRALAKEFGED